MDVTQIKSGIYYVGVNDRTKHRFEGLWPLPQGVSYNSYLVVDEKVALIDTVDAAYTDIFLDSVRRRLGDRPIDYLVVNHMEPDHSASLRAVLGLYPDMTVVGNRQTVKMLEGYFGNLRTLEVADGQTLSLGRETLAFYLTPMIHWPETMVTLAAEDKVLFTGDIFGTFGALDGGITDSQLDFERYRDEMRRYYSNIVGKYGSAVQRSFPKIEALDFDTVCPAHGPVWQSRIGSVVEMYSDMSQYKAERGVVIAYGSMYGNNEQAAELLARKLAGLGVKQIRLHNLSVSHVSYVLSDIFRFDSLVAGAPTYNGTLFPPVKELLDEVRMRQILHRRFGVFGSYSWAGCAVKQMCAFAEQMGWEMVSEPVEFAHAHTHEKTGSGLQTLAERLAR